ncbi:MAG: ferredoxin [Candidatus Melainabacteria bacterium]
MHVRIAPGCIACGVCESLCPEVFTVVEDSVADNTHVPGRENACREAADACPVCVIVIEE